MCKADANPPANVVWHRMGLQEIYGTSEVLRFNPVNQRDSGSYSCVASNSVGTSQPISTTVDIKCK